jgi:peptide/nickel transport system permease protein
MAGESAPVEEMVAPAGEPSEGRRRRRAASLLDARGSARWLLAIGGVIVTGFTVAALLAQWLAPYGFDQYRTAGGVRFATLAHPSSAHLLGTNSRSSDVLSVVIYGSRTALEVVVLSVAASIPVGVSLGLVSGFFGGIGDRILVLLMDALFAFPYLLLAIVVAFVLSNSVSSGIITASIAITVVYVPQYFRVVRNTVVSVREEPYVEAARALGARPARIVTRYVFLNVIQTIPVIATLNAADSILTLAGLGFLGYGVDPSQAAEWGYALQRAIPDAESGIWWTTVGPGLAIVLLVTGLTLVGEGLNEVMNPVLREAASGPLVMPDRTDGRAG